MEADYRPLYIKFDVTGKTGIEAPEHFLKEFKTGDEATKFVHSNFVAVGEKVTGLRFLDPIEIENLRKDYSELLEHQLPILEKELQEAKTEFERAKRKLQEAQEMVSANMLKVKALAHEVRKGNTPIDLDEKYTWGIAVNNHYFYYTYVDKQIKLVKVVEIPDNERLDLYNAMSSNDEVFDVIAKDGLTAWFKKQEKTKVKKSAEKSEEKKEETKDKSRGRGRPKKDEPIKS